MVSHYAVISGKGEEVNVFLPGTGWSRDIGTPIAEALNSGFVTHMIDLPGIGRSNGLEGIIREKDSADWLNKYIKQKGIKKVNIIGHSLGGFVGLTYAYHYPDKVSQLILLDFGYSKIERFPVGMMGSVGYILPIISLLHLIFGQRMLGNETDTVQSTQEQGITEEEIRKTIEELGLEDTSFIRKAIQSQQRTSIEGISLLLSAYRSNIPKMVKNIKVPCLILYGSRENQSAKSQKR